MDRVLVALTGPPCSGKTTLAERLAARGAHIVPEAAIEVIRELNQELGGADAQRAWRRAHVAEFQRLVAARQLQREREALAAGPELGNLVVFDRTSIDGVAYLTRAGEAVPAEIEAAARATRPDLVFELEVLAHAFDARGSTGRSSTLADAREIAQAIHTAYRHYGHRTITLAAALSPEQRADVVLHEVDRLRHH